MKLPSFPVPVEGETVRSVVARFLGRTAGHMTRKLELLGLLRTAYGSIVPLDLGRLANVMPSGHPWHGRPEEILLRHTPFKTHLSFASAERNRKIVEQLCAGRSPYVSVLLGLSRRPLMGLPALTRFCPACVSEDIRLRGFPVGYVEHELSLVAVCSRHRVSLVKSCARCFVGRKAAGLWKMAGACSCVSPEHSSSLEDWTGVAASSPDLEWMAAQVRQLQLQELPGEGGRLDGLKHALMDCGYRANGGIDAVGILSALGAKFERPFLEHLQLATAPHSRRSVLWPSRLFSRSDSLPDTLRCLILTSLIPGGILAVPTTRTTSMAIEPRVPRGYGSKQALGTSGATREQMEMALAKHSGKITVAAAALGVAPATLVSQLLQRGATVPLSPSVRQRLGESRLCAVEEALASGMPKREIQQVHRVSEWTVSLIELAKPDLRQEHRAATVERQRENHRQLVQDYLQAHPCATRVEIRRDCSGAIDWLEKFDRQWLASHWPTRRVAATKTRKVIIDWVTRDQLLADDVVQLALTWKAESDRPTRVTRTRLLSEVGALVAMDAGRGRLPKTLRAADAHAESVEDYQRRRLRWALLEHQRLGTPVSTNLTRRLSAFPPQVLMQHGAYIVQLAKELDVPIDARCSIGEQGGAAVAGN